MPTVLIAEDDTLFADKIIKILSRKGLDVLTTNNGIEAIQLIRERHPEVLLLDVHLPGTSGLNILKEAKELDPQVKVIMITAASDTETESRALELGAYAFLKKPIIVEVLFKLFADLGIVK